MPKPFQWPEPGNEKALVGRSLLEAYFGVMQMQHKCACPEMWDDVISFAQMVYQQGVLEGSETTLADLRSFKQSGRV